MFCCVSAFYFTTLTSQYHVCDIHEYSTLQFVILEYLSGVFSVFWYKFTHI